MVRKPTGKANGRPNAKIDWNEVDKALMEGANGAQIAASMGIHPDTLYLNCEKYKGMGFTAYAQEKRSIGDKIIHQTQYQVAVETKNTTMLIWLGKQRLGQKENDDLKKVSEEQETRHQELMVQIKQLQEEAKLKPSSSQVIAKYTED